ncbi:MAG: cupin domain-containing protein [Caldilinea sp.]|nr:cupin domain-containing protein [Caldilineaceae bacterium]MCO5209028.1 cupin domain-containing protein [Caldilinea sp.]
MAEPFIAMTALQEPVAVAADSIVSRTLYTGDDVRVILFAFAPGQELSEHTASRPALIHILTGSGRIGLGDEHFDAAPGLLVHMAAGLSHSIVATTELRMLLYLFGK